MDIRAFAYKMYDYNFAELDDTYILYKLKGNQWELYNAMTEESEYFDGLNHERLIELIEPLEEIDIVLEGGRGAGGGGKFKWGSGGMGKGKSDTDLPARANNKIKTKTYEEAVRTFREMHGSSAKEHAFVVDRQGFVHSYTHGNESSVRVGKEVKGGMVIHNHPNNSTFSTADMMHIAQSKARGIVATHSQGYRQVVKGTHFDAVGFTKAIKKAQRQGLRGKDINSAVDSFLTRNQKKYGYTFTHVRDTKPVASKPKTASKPKATKPKATKPKAVPKVDATTTVADTAGFTKYVKDNGISLFKKHM